MIPYGDRWDRRWASPWIDIGDAERPSAPTDATPPPLWIRLLSPSRWDRHSWRVAGVLGVLFMLGAFVATQQGLEALKYKRDRVPKALASIAIAQEQFKQHCEVDEDGDGYGEYGWLGEMSGEERSARQGGVRMSWSPYVAAIMGVKDARGRSVRWGRWFRMYLPDETGAMHGEPPVLSPSRAATRFLSPAGAGRREQGWACVAWQKDAGAWDPRAFYVDQHGVVWKSGCEVHDYRGSQDGPKPEDVQPKQGTLADYAKTLQPFTAKDGNVWRPVSREAWAVE